MGPKSAKFTAYVLYTPLLGGLALVMLAQYFYVVPFLLGFAFFFQAKRSVLRPGNLVSFGPSQMTPKMKSFYWIGYAIMILSVAIGGWLVFRTSYV